MSFSHSVFFSIVFIIVTAAAAITTTLVSAGPYDGWRYLVHARTASRYETIPGQEKLFPRDPSKGFQPTIGAPPNASGAFFVDAEDVCSRTFLNSSLQPGWLFSPITSAENSWQYNFWQSEKSKSQYYW